MRLFLVAFGKLKTPGLRDAADYYMKLLRPWVPIEEIELKPIPVPDKSAATRALIQEQEARILIEKLSSRVSSRGRVFFLDEKGKQFTTQAWSEKVRDWEGHGISEVAFCIGSSLGFNLESNELLKKKSAGTFSLGLHTLPHELARVVYLEQLYRAWSVTRGHPYHNQG